MASGCMLVKQLDYTLLADARFRMQPMICERVYPTLEFNFFVILRSSNYSILLKIFFVIFELLSKSTGNGSFDSLNLSTKRSFEIHSISPF